MFARIIFIVSLILVTTVELSTPGTFDYEKQDWKWKIENLISLILFLKI